MINTSPAHIVRFCRLPLGHGRPLRSEMPRVFALLSRLVAVAVALVFSPPPLHAALVTSSAVQLSWGILSGPDPSSRPNASRSLIGPGPIGLFVQPFSVSQSGTFSGLNVGDAKGLTSGFGAFSARAMTEARGEGGPGDFIVGEAGAEAAIRFQVQVGELRPPPFPLNASQWVGFPSVIMDSFVLAEAERTGGPDFASGARARASVNIGATSPNQAAAVAFREDDHEVVSNLDQEFLFMSPDSVLSVTLRASTGANASVVGGSNGALVSARATAIADPVFSFNQQGFEEFAQSQGFPAFNLADFYGFVFSPMGVPEPPPGGEPVPAPWTLMLTSLGAGGLALLHSLRKRPRGPRRRHRRE
jgi:hypothetical protein